MSEKLTDGDLEWARKVAEHMPTDSRTLLADPAHWTALLANTVAEYRDAAEERGRRAGIEERDELRELLRNVRPLIREEFLRAGAMTERGWEKFLARVDVALAPRDSGKECADCESLDHWCPVHEKDRK